MTDYPFLEKHVSGNEDSETVGWLWHIDAEHMVWCGEISRARFDEMEIEHQEAMRDDYGWYLILYSNSRSVVLGKALDEYQGEDLAHTIALGLLANPKMIATLLQDTPDWKAAVAADTVAESKLASTDDPIGSSKPSQIPQQGG